MKESELKPCPFCGGEAVAEKGEVWCSKCFTNSAIGISQDEAVKNWNSRVPQSEWVSVEIDPKPECDNDCVPVDCWDGSKRVADCMYLAGLGIYMHHSGKIDATHYMLNPKPPRG